MTRNRKEAIEAGVKVAETKHQMKRRSPWHDYREKGTYMLTMVVAGRKPLLGRLIPAEKPAGTVAEPAGTGAAVAARVELTALGKAIRDEEIRKIGEHYRMVEVWKLCIMPDHIHMIVRVKEEMPEGKNLGQVVWGFKVGCTKAWWRLMPGEEPRRPAEKPRRPAEKPSGTGAAGAAGAALGTGAASVPAGSSAGKASLFEPGYNDKILLREGQLDNWKHYLDDNPRRLAIKRQRPDLFRVVSDAFLVDLNSHTKSACQLVGNRFLMDIPQKMAVIVHGAYSDKDYAEWKEKWLDCGEAGGVLVSAAIATREKEVMREAMDRGYSIILLRENGFPPLYKPAGEAFDACSEGQLLQVSPWEYLAKNREDLAKNHEDLAKNHEDLAKNRQERWRQWQEWGQRKHVISREQCLMLNRLAEQIADGTMTISLLE